MRILPRRKTDLEDYSKECPFFWGGGKWGFSERGNSSQLHRVRRIKGGVRMENQAHCTELLEGSGHEM